MKTKDISKFLSLVLRHKPETIGIQLDQEGWVDVNELLQRLQANKKPISLEKLKEVVETNDKKRFAFNQDCTKIRASQGHSIDVDLAYSPTEPLDFLYHGTIASALPEIQQSGIQKMSRTHVHLSKDMDTARIVGARRGKPIILTIRAKEMYQQGHSFYLSANGVWLCNAVPVEFINFPQHVQ